MTNHKTKEDELVEPLATLGLTVYEARAYVSLVMLGASSGYAVAKHAGIPTAKIYEALASLVAKGFAVSNGMRKTLYQAANPTEILATMKVDVNRRIDTITESLGKMSAGNRLTASLATGTDKIDSHVRDILSATKQQLLMTAWPQELERFSRELEQCAQRCNVMLLTYGEFDLPGAEVIVHRRVDLVKREISGRMLLMASDGTRGEIASYGDQPHASHGILVMDESFTSILADHFIHDASLNHLMNILPPRQAADAEKRLTAFRKRAYLNIMPA